MYRNRLYYGVKPLLPASVRMGVRRWFALRKRGRVQSDWPILPGSEKPPVGWAGWPEGKQFSLVLTHDVEGTAGLQKVKQLAELEMSLGFRSCFNFVPEGDYVVPPELRHWLVKNGFEVGVHDLKHDGHLFSNRAEFERCAPRINSHLKDWGAAGFRGGFMLRNLDWIHELEIEYDASTFDTDPFEPQPEGARTIFPYWVSKPDSSLTQNLSLRTPGNSLDPEPGPDLAESGYPNSTSRAGYVELPYTLPQDSTIFLLLRERTPEVWLRKLDWVANNRGMALLITHPDYMNFTGKNGSGLEYPCDHYRHFLECVRRNYSGQYWHTTATKLAAWYRKALPPTHSPERGSDSVVQPRLTGKRAAVLLYSYYPSDPRPRREAEALASAGMTVDLICLREKAEEPVRETINRVNVRRLPIRRRRGGKLTYVAQYVSFVGLCLSVLAWRSVRKRYDLVHVHNMPDFLVFGALGPKLRGAEVILDLHDPMPELMMTIFGLREASRTVRLLRWIEKQSIRFADRVLTVNLACKRIFALRSCTPEKITVVMNAPDEKIFGFKSCNGVIDRDPARPFVIMYHGSIVERHGLDLAVQALRLVRKRVPMAELRIYGLRTPFLDSVLASVQSNGLHDAVHYLGEQNLEQIVNSIEECDLGIIPNRRSVFTEINTPTRIFEYLSRGKPVVAPRVPGIADYFGEQDLLFFQLGDAEDLARQIEFAYFQSGQLEAIIKRGQQVYLGERWSRKQTDFLNVVGDLLAHRP